MAEHRWAVVPDWIIDKHLNTMDASTLKVYLYLSRWANRNGRVWRSQKRMAEDCGMSTRSIIRALSNLESIEAITCPNRGARGTRETNRYYLGTVGRGKVGDTSVT